MTNDRIAPEGAIWVCGACGKTALDRYGDPNSGWDESCMLNSILCTTASIVRGEHGRVVKADQYEAAAS